MQSIVVAALYKFAKLPDYRELQRGINDGKIQLIGIEPSLGKGPQNLAITKNGKYLLCANMPGKNLAVFSIDSNTGKLKSVGKPAEIQSPSCIMIHN